MPDGIQLLTYRIQVTVEEVRISGAPAYLTSPPPLNAVFPPNPLATDSDLITWLNRNSAIIAHEMENEVRCALAQQFEVRMEMTFSAGSLLAFGTVVLTSLAPLVIETGKKVAEDTLAEIIEFAVRKVLGSWFPYFSVDITKEPAVRAIR